MVTGSELLRVLLAPALVALALAAVGRWRGWVWMMPLAAGFGFCAGYALLGVPRLPPRDGTDWVFWLALPATALGVLDARVRRRWGWVMGAAAGFVAFIVASPLPPETVPRRELWMMALLMAAVGMGVVAAVGMAEKQVGPWAVAGALCIAAGGAAVAVMSSHLRIVGVYAIAAASALGAVAAAVGSLPAGRSLAIVATALMAGLLAGGHYYAVDGVSWKSWIVLLAAPLLLLTGVVVPGKRRWVKGVAGLAAVYIAVGLITVPAALAAKKAAEAAADDPYAEYSKGYP